MATTVSPATSPVIGTGPVITVPGVAVSKVMRLFGVVKPTAAASANRGSSVSTVGRWKRREIAWSQEYGFRCCDLLLRMGASSWLENLANASASNQTGTRK